MSCFHVLQSTPLFNMYACVRGCVRVCLGFACTYTSMYVCIMECVYVCTYVYMRVGTACLPHAHRSQMVPLPGDADLPTRMRDPNLGRVAALSILWL